MRGSSATCSRIMLWPQAALSTAFVVLHLALAPECALAAREATLTVINNSGVEICYIFLAPAGGNDWGRDWLGKKDTLPPDERRTFRLTAGAYDARAEDCDNNILSELHAAEITRDINWTISDSDAPGGEDIAPAGDEEAPAQDVALDQLLCCGTSVGGTNVWSIRYPAGWEVEYFGARSNFTGAAFFDPDGSIRVTFLPSGMPEAGSALDTGNVDEFLDALVQVRRQEDAGFREFLRQAVPGAPDTFVWGGTWPGRGEKMWEAYLVYVAPLAYVGPQTPHTYLLLLGVRAASTDWAAGVKIYEDMLASAQIKAVKEGGAEVDAGQMGRLAVEPGMVRFCPKECDWEWISASDPGWPCPVTGEESSLWEVPCERSEG